MNRLIKHSYRLTVILLSFILPVAAFSQITITGDDILALIGDSGTIEVDTSGSIAVDVGVASPNEQTWDFTFGIPDPFKLNFAFKGPAGTPFATFFPGANFVTCFIDLTGDLGAQSVTFFNYLTITDQSFTSLGGGLETTNPDTIFIFREFNEEAPLPLQFGNTWNSMTTETFGDPGIFAVVITTNAMHTADAWGTVMLPLGDFDCLRVGSDLEIISQTIQGGQVVLVDTVNTTQYTWLSQDNFFTVASATTEPTNGMGSAVGGQYNRTDANFTQAIHFERLFEFTVSVEDPLVNAEIPTDFELFQNYPNPFNPETVIKYHVPHNGEVGLAIFNLLGQKVRELVKEIKTAGSYEVRWDGTDDFGRPVTSGVYYYRLKSGDFTRTKKMVFLQ